MKNHWLDKKLDKEIDAACEDDVFKNASFGLQPRSHARDGDSTLRPQVEDCWKDSPPIDSLAPFDLCVDLSQAGQSDRYKEYERIKFKETEFPAALEEELSGVDENERAVVREIILKHKNDKIWLNEVLGDVFVINDIWHIEPYNPDLQLDGNLTLGNSTISDNFVDGHITITLNTDFCDGPLPIIVDQNTPPIGDITIGGNI